MLFWTSITREEHGISFGKEYSGNRLNDFSYPLRCDILERTRRPWAKGAIMDRFFSELDRYLFGVGRHYQIYEKMGAHPCIFE